MNIAETDALVSIIKAAIQKEVADFRQAFEREQKRSLINVVKASVESDVLRWSAEMDARIKAAVAEIPKPLDGLNATPEMVSEQVKAYIEANPVQPPEPLEPKPEALLNAVKAYMADNPIPAPAEGKDATPEMVAEKVSEWIKANPVQPLAPTIDQLKTAVDLHLKDHPVQPGERGLDAVEINILPSIDQARRYAKGTYAQYDGGIIRASRDTDPGEPLKSGWDVVVRGVSAIEVHQLDAGEFAIKSVLTGGASHITKAHFPTMEYKGVWKESNGQYKKGHTVTQSGSLWVCLADTADKPGTSDSWQLAAKRGTDGKDLSLVKLNRPDTYKLGDK